MLCIRRIIPFSDSNKTTKMPQRQNYAHLILHKYYFIILSLEVLFTKNISHDFGAEYLKIYCNIVQNFPICNSP